MSYMDVSEYISLLQEVAYSHGHLLCSHCSNYIPEVRIMSIPNLRYMKVSGFFQKCHRVRCGCGIFLGDDMV